MITRLTKTTPFALTLLITAIHSYADSNINDDQVVVGSQCVGTDCVNGENFGFDTFRLKENNTRIRFQDTSNSSSFPTNDWQILANESSNGGQNMLAIEDIDGGTRPFVVEAGADDSALYIDDSNKVGLGTSSPLMDLHVTAGDSPAVRLEQDSSSGFSSYSWDLGANESNFFLRDASNASNLPLKVAAGAPTDSLVVDAGGNVSSEGTICSNSGGVADCIGTVPSSIHIKQIVEYVDTSAILEAVSQLSMPKWYYTANGESIQHIGPIAEEFQAAFGLNGGVSDKIATVDLSGVALASIQELSKQVKQKDQEITELRQELAEIKRLLLQK